MQNVTIGVYNSNLEIIGLINQVESLTINHNLQTPSTFSLTTLLTEDNIDILELKNYLILNTNEKTKADVFIIEYVQKNLNSDGSTSLVVQANNLLSILKRRVLTKLYNYTNTDVGIIIQDILNSECIDPEDSNRKFPNFVLGNLTLDATINQINPLTSFSNPELGTSVEQTIGNILEAVGIGLTITANLDTKVFTVDFINGVDRTLEQSNTNPVVLANELNNLMSQEFTTNISNYTNVCYVSGTIGNTTEQVMYIPNDNIPSGYDRWESSQQCEIEGLNASDYIKQYEAIASTYIATQDIYNNSSVDFNIENADYTFNKEFALGDIVTFISKEWKIKESIQIVQATETWKSGGYSISLQLGKQQPTLAKILKKR